MMRNISKKFIINIIIIIFFFFRSLYCPRLREATSFLGSGWAEGGGGGESHYSIGRQHFS